MDQQVSFLGLFCLYIGLFCLLLGLFCLYIGLFCMYVVRVVPTSHGPTATFSPTARFFRTHSLTHIHPLSKSFDNRHQQVMDQKQHSLALSLSHTYTHSLSLSLSSSLSLGVESLDRRHQRVMDQQQYQHVKMGAGHGTPRHVHFARQVCMYM